MGRGLTAHGARKCCVYLVTNPAGQVKVGRSSRLVTRVSELGVACAGGVTLVYSWRMKVAEAVALEGAMHRALKPFRVSGEWFAAGVEDVQGVGELLVAGNAERAAQLVGVLADIYRIDGELQRLSRMLAGLTNFHAARKREILAQEETLLDEQARLRASSYELGALPDEAARFWMERERDDAAASA